MNRLVLVASLVHFTSSLAYAGIIYDATADFSTAANPNGVWSYHFSDDTVRDGSYDLFTEVDPAGGSPGGPGIGSLLWHADAGVATGQRPFAGINTTSPGSSSWALNELALHPGQSGGGGGDGLAVLSWTSPVTGTADVSFSLAMGLGGNVAWFFEQNNSATTLDSGTLIGSSATDTISLLGLSITAGDRLNLVLDNNGIIGNDLVRLTSATIETNAVPEPSAIALMVCGFGGFLIRKRFAVA